MITIWSNNSRIVKLKKKNYCIVYFHTYLTIYNTQLQNIFNLLVITLQKITSNLKQNFK